ncbi:MAG: Fe-S cluster assembly protein SufD [Bacteroidia bacterium]
MTSPTVAKDQLKEAIIAVFRQNVSESTPDFPLRHAAKEAIHTLDIPTRKHEAWKYTNLKPVLSQGFVPAPQVSINSVSQFLIPGLDADVLTFVNGQFQPSLSDLSRNGENLVITPMHQLPDSEKELLETHFGTLANTETDFFTALNTAFASEGVVIKVPQSRIAPAPVHLLHIHHSGGQAAAIQTRNLFVVEKGAGVKILESSHSLSHETAALSNAVTEIRVGQNASAEYIQLQMESAHSSRITRTEVYQEADSRFSTFTITLSGQLVRNNLNIRLGGPNGESILMGAYLLSGLQHLDNHTQVDHIAPHCYSNELYKGMIAEKATGVFNGKIHVHRDAQKTNAFQSNRNILLSDTANIYTKPQLEIYADDVKCSHGATTGRLDEDAMFYLQARGIPADKARMILVHAFIMEVVENISLEPVADYIASLIDQTFA